jgi:hypothetical protein
MNNRPTNGTDEDKMNNHKVKLLSDYKKSAPTTKLDSIDHSSPPSAGYKTDGFFSSPMMKFTELLENLDNIATEVKGMTGDNAPLEETPVEDDPPIGDDNTPEVGLSQNNDEELLNQLNQIFTPILVMHGVEGDIKEQVQEACSEDNVLLERNIINFDDSTRMAQLVSVCALLIARQKNTKEYQMYKKAADIKNSMKLDIQKREYSAANDLAQKFLVKVSTTNGSSIARKTATSLLPETQH